MYIVMIDVPRKRDDKQNAYDQCSKPIFPSYSYFKIGHTFHMQRTQRPIDPDQCVLLRSSRSICLQTVLSLDITWAGLRLHGATKSIDASMEPLESNGA